MSDLEDVCEAEGDVGDSTVEVVLLPADIPGAELSEPLEKHPVAALRWWLLCRGIKVSTSVRKKDLVERLGIPRLSLAQPSPRLSLSLGLYYSLSQP